jgi:hypothetical protein
VPLSVDPNLPRPPHNATHLTFKERYSRVSNRIGPIFHACQVQPVSLGVFGGQLNFCWSTWCWPLGPRLPSPISPYLEAHNSETMSNFSRLQWWAMIFVVLVLQIPAGDRRNWKVIRDWAVNLPALFTNAASERKFS